MRQSITRADVARLAGVSSAVVSYVVNEGPRNVSEQTRGRVLAAIQELGYRPNANARALRARTSRTLGLLVPSIANPYFAELADALEAAAFARGRTLLIGSSHEDAAREARYLGEFMERRVDGVIVVSVAGMSGAGESSVRTVLDAGIALVLLDRPVEGLDDVPYIAIDNEAAGFAATQHLIEHGHTLIGCVAGPQDQAVARARRDGWRRAMEGQGLTDLDALLTQAPFSPEGGYQAATALLSDTEATAVFVSSDGQSHGVIAAARDRGRRVPDDIAVLGFDGTSQSQFSEPRLSVIEQPIEEMALSTLLALEEQTGGARLAPFRLVTRSSCGC